MENCPHLRAAAIDHIEVFMLVRHDTTFSTICYAAYALFKHLEALLKVLREYDNIWFGCYADCRSPIRRSYPIPPQSSKRHLRANQVNIVFAPDSPLLLLRKLARLKFRTFLSILLPHLLALHLLTCHIALKIP